MQTESAQARITPPRVADLLELDQDINAFVEVFDDGPVCSGPLSDLRFGVKEVIEQSGRVTPLGASALGDRIGRSNAEIVDNVLGAGAERVATTRSTVLAIAGDSGTRNPLDLLRTPGGSSAGSAAAVAAGFLDFALGTQTVGSIIRPASYCGVVGFKPTFDSLPTRGVMCLARELDHVGLIGKDVETVARVFNAVAATMPPGGGLTKALIPDLWFDAAPHPSVARTCARMADVLEDLGLPVTHHELPLAVRDEEAETLDGLLCKGVHDNHRAFVEANVDTLPEELVEFARRGAAITPETQSALLASQGRLKAIMDTLVDPDTVVVLPSVLDEPPRFGCGTGLREPQRLWTLLGWPAISIPVGTYGTEKDSLSIGIQLAAKPGRDAALLDLAATLEGRRS